MQKLSVSNPGNEPESPSHSEKRQCSSHGDERSQQESNLVRFLVNSPERNRPGLIGLQSVKTIMPIPDLVQHLQPIKTSR